MLLMNLNKQPIITERTCRKVFLFTNARDEYHIKEWVTHHLLIGFDIIYIFDHKSRTPLVNVFSDFNDSRVKIERCEKELPVKLYLMKRAVNIAKASQADWMLYLDADEFLVLNAFKRVKQMLNVFKNADSVGINWLLFGTNYHVKEPIGLLMDNYTKCAKYIDKHVKTFVRPSQVRSVTNPHYYNIYSPNKMVGIDKKILNRNMEEYSFHTLTSNNRYNNVDAYIAHYHTQSEETYQRRKVSRGQDDGSGTRTVPNDFHLLYNEIDNTDISLKYSQNIKLFLSSKEPVSSSNLSL